MDFINAKWMSQRVSVLKLAHVHGFGFMFSKRFHLFESVRIVPNDNLR